MNALLFDLAVRGTLVSIVVLLLDAALGRRQEPGARRLWWLLVALTWLLPFHLPRAASVPAWSMPRLFAVKPGRVSDRPTDAAATHPNLARDWSGFVAPIWLGGAALSFAVIFLRTVRTSRRWSKKRLSTRPELLELLEDCKAASGVRTPFGLIVTSQVSTPALLGWLRPRILLPESLVASVDREELRGILLHELAHFRSADIPLQWLFCLGQSLHWFNPLVYLATRRWIRFRELAADASALAWMPSASRDAYGDALVAAVRQANLLPIPQGALALGESLQQLKFRIHMIASTRRRSRLVWLAALVSLVLLSVILLPPAAFANSTGSEETAKAAAQLAANAWLKLTDEGQYAETWNTAASSFKQAYTSEQWSKKLEDVRRPLGKRASRTNVSEVYQTKVPTPDGQTLEGEFMTEQYNSSYENLRAARETLWLTKDEDGQWRVVGYLIKPR